MKKLHLYILFILLSSTACEDILDVEPASQYSREFLNSASGVRSVFYSAYDNIQYDFNHGSQRIYVEECMTDVFINFRGALNGGLQPYQDFNHNSNSAYLFDTMWKKCYDAIKDANTLLDVLPNHPDLSEEEEKLLIAESHFIRGLAYQFLYGWFGPIPLIDDVYQSAEQEFNVSKANENEIVNFIINEFTLAATELPVQQTQFGRATKGAALASLAKFHLQNRNWTEAAIVAKQVIDLGVYNLWPNYLTLFSLENEGHNEMIFAFPCVNVDGNGNVWVANALPPLYPVNITNTATQVCVPVAFYNSFSDNDLRKKLMLSSYTNVNGVSVDLTTGVEFRNPRSLKYPIDLNADQRTGGQDIPLYRYADVLLARAEALVMSSGSVNDEALNLLNQVHTRAGLPAFTEAEVPDAATFINLLLQERAWEFYSEAKRREDLIRHDRFVQNALDRGKQSAKPHHVRFPIPQRELDANKNLEQNEGY